MAHSVGRLLHSFWISFKVACKHRVVSFEPLEGPTHSTETQTALQLASPGGCFIKQDWAARPESCEHDAVNQCDLFQIKQTQHLNIRCKNTLYPDNCLFFSLLCDTRGISVLYFKVNVTPQSTGRDDVMGMCQISWLRSLLHRRKQKFVWKLNAEQEGFDHHP